MVTKFKCPNCLLIFESEGRKEEYNSVTYGPCFKYVADCPSCGSESSEYRVPSQKQTSAYSRPPCGAGGCCCHN